MTFTKLTFRIAGIWGLVVLLPMYFLYDKIGQRDPPALSHPHFYFGWLGVTLAWQVLFMILASDPIRYRPMMIPAMLEKLGFVLAVLILAGMKMVSMSQAVPAIPDAVLFALFVVGYRKTSGVSPATSHGRSV